MARKSPASARTGVGARVKKVKVATTAAASVGTASCEQIRVWVLSWFSRLKGRHVPGSESLKELRYDDDADLGYFTDHFNAAFMGQLTSAELMAEWEAKNQTLDDLIDFLCSKLDLPKAIVATARQPAAFPATSASVASYHQIYNWVLSWFKNVKGRVVAVTETLKSLRYDDDADLGYFTDNFDGAFHAAITTTEIASEFAAKGATVGALIDFLSRRVP
jgi:hypothetical protein